MEDEPRTGKPERMRRYFEDRTPTLPPQKQFEEPEERFSKVPGEEPAVKKREPEIIYVSSGSSDDETDRDQEANHPLRSFEEPFRVESTFPSSKHAPRWERKQRSRFRQPPFRESSDLWTKKRPHPWCKPPVSATVHIVRALPLSLDFIFMKQEEMAWPGVPAPEAPSSSKAAPHAKKQYGPLAALAQIPPAPADCAASPAHSNFSIGIETSRLAQDIASKVRKCLETNVMMVTYEQRLEQIYMEHRQTSDVLHAKLDAVEELKKVTQRKIGFCYILAAGSMASDSSIAVSPLDIAVCSGAGLLQREALRDAVTSSGVFGEYLGEGDTTDVPCLGFSGKLSYNPNDDLDLFSFGIRIWLSEHSYRTAFLLRSLARIDKRFSELCLLLKAYFHHALPQVQEKGHVLTLLAVHYLQTGVSPPVLPILRAIDPMHFDADSRLQDLTDSVALPAPYAHELNRQTISELFMGFFLFYKSFDFARRAVSVSESVRTKTKQRSANPVAMEVLDPYHQTNVAAHMSQRDFFAFLKTIEDFCSTTFHS